VEFVAVAVAVGLEADTDAVEERCEALVAQALLCPLGVTTWPNGTIATRYAFRHGLYQQVVYQGLGAGRRVRLHQRLGGYLEAAYGAQAGEIAAELAEHFVRGRDTQRAVSYLRQAAENAAQRYAQREAIALLTRALTLLRGLPETPERIRQELDLQLVLGPALVAMKGYAAPEVAQPYTRALALCEQVGETPQPFPTLLGLCRFYRNRGEVLKAWEIGDRLYRLAQRMEAPTHLLEAHDALGSTLFFLGKYDDARRHLAQGIALTRADPAAQRALVLHHSVAPRVACLTLAALTLWCLGYPVQALRQSQEALALAQALAHPHSLAVAQHWAAFLHHHRGEAQAVKEQAEALLTLATTQRFPLYMGYGTCWRSWALAVQGQGEAGIAQLRQGMAAVLATGQMLTRTFCPILLAEAARDTGQVEEGLRLLAEALTALETSGRGDLLAEAYRLQGTLLLQQSTPDAAQAETCFQQALTIARRQQAKSWELRAATSLARLWQQQGKRTEAQQLLAEVYG
jgi:predicted ATPase